MKLPESFFSRILLAALPFMAWPLSLLKTGVAAAWVVVFLWVTIFFFWFTRRLFPKGASKTAFVLWLLVWAQAAWTLTKLPPLWILSVFFLTPVSFLEDTNKPEKRRIFSREVPQYFFDRVLTGIGFAGFVMILALFRRIGNSHFGTHLFEQPVGLLLVAAGVAFLWKNQPYGQKG